MKDDLLDACSSLVGGFIPAFAGWELKEGCVQCHRHQRPQVSFQPLLEWELKEDQSGQRGEAGLVSFQPLLEWELKVPEARSR